MFEILEIMKTEAFWAPIAGIVVLFIIVAIILIDRYRRPEIYSKKPLEEKDGTD